MSNNKTLKRMDMELIDYTIKATRWKEQRYQKDALPMQSFTAEPLARKKF